MNPQFWSFQSDLANFEEQFLLICCNNLADFYQILRWAMSRLGSLDTEWPSHGLVWKEALTICQDRLFASFLYVLSLSSVLGSFIHMYCDTGSLGKYTPASEFLVNVSKGWEGGWESEILLGKIFLPGKGNLRRRDFDNLNLFQS